MALWLSVFKIYERLSSMSFTISSAGMSGGMAQPRTQQDCNHIFFDEQDTCQHRSLLLDEPLHFSGLPNVRSSARWPRFVIFAVVSSTAISRYKQHLAEKAGAHAFQHASLLRRLCYSSSFQLEPVPFAQTSSSGQTVIVQMQCIQYRLVPDESVRRGCVKAGMLKVTSGWRSTRPRLAAR